jgi:peptidoglycan L-alanyl-D-glutamate endopeptidase CwlK
MAYRYSETSRRRLQTCHPLLQAVMIRAIGFQVVDISILEGHRLAERQTEMLETGRSKLGPWKSMHSPFPALAVDAAPYFSDGRRIPWDSRDEWLRFAGVVEAAAALEEVQIRWGGDWDRDWNHKDQTFHDLPHFEMIVPTAEFARAISQTRESGSWMAL